MNKAPAFQFYAADFLADEKVMLMSIAARGIYITLLAVQWREGSIPVNPLLMAKLCGCDSSAIESHWHEVADCFTVCDFDAARMVNPRLEEQREKLTVFKENRSQAGKMGAKARWNKVKKTDGSAKVLPMANHSSSSSSSSSSSIINTHISDSAKFPLKDLLEAFPDVQFTPAQLGMIEAEVKPIDAEAWRRTIDTYKANYNPMTNTYRPEKVGNLLNVLKSERVKIERELAREHNTNGKPKPSTSPKLSGRGDTAETLRRLGIS